jgi:hypothetical protein
MARERGSELGDVLAGADDIPIMEDVGAPNAATQAEGYRNWALAIIPEASETKLRQIINQTWGPFRAEIVGKAREALEARKREQRAAAGTGAFELPNVEPADIETIPAPGVTVPTPDFDPTGGFGPVGDGGTVALEDSGSSATVSIQSIGEGIGKQKAAKKIKPPPAPPPRIEPEQAEIMDLSYFRKAQAGATTAEEYAAASEGVEGITGAGAARGAALAGGAAAGLVAAEVGMMIPRSPPGSISEYMVGGGGGRRDDGADGSQLLQALQKIGGIASRM